LARMAQADALISTISPQFPDYLVERPK